MKEIKSFREYIAEHKLFEDENPPVENNSKAPVVNNKLNVVDAQLKLTKRDPFERLKELKDKAELTRKTYENLYKFVNGEFSERSDSNNPDAMFNITNKTSFKTIFDNWYNEYKTRIGSQKENREDVARVSNIMKGTQKKLFKSKAQKESEAKDRENLSKRYKIEKETDNTNSQPQEELKTEETIDEAFRIRNPFVTASELASGMKNKYNSDRILTSIARSKAGKESDRLGKKGVYGDLEKGTGLSGKSELARMKERYEKNAYAIIAKQKAIGLSYLKRAEKNINSYLEKKKYLRNITDEEYLSSISSDLGRAMGVLTDIGRDLQNLMNEYDKSLHKISGELSAQDVKNEKYVTGLNARQAISKYDEKMGNKAQKEGEKQEAEDIEKGKAEEKEAFHKAIVDKVQGDIEAAKGIDEKAAVEFYNFLESISRRKEITPELLLSKLDKEVNVASRNDKDKLANIKSYYAAARLLMDGKLKDYITGPQAKNSISKEGTSKLYDLLSSISGDVDSIAEDARKILLSPDELKKYKANKESEAKEKENKEVEKLKKAIETKASNVASDFVKNNEAISYYTIKNRIENDIENSDKYYAKVDDYKLKKNEQKIASACVSYALIKLFIEKKIKSFRNENINAEAMAVSFIRDALKILSKDYDNDVNKFNKNLLKLVDNRIEHSIDHQEQKKAFTSASDTSSSEDEKETDEAGKNPVQTKAAAGAKDFDGEPADEPKNIFDYAVQKAKKLQSR